MLHALRPDAWRRVRILRFLRPDASWWMRDLVSGSSSWVVVVVSLTVRLWAVASHRVFVVRAHRIGSGWWWVRSGRRGCGGRSLRGARVRVPPWHADTGRQFSQILKARTW
ncbi:hypothetical protein [Streptomyces fradiae]|uniref:hypothetical protein n=1 Tax=Streptomyces fradiae TaxID=1906 RepID=UPI0029425969|nr:hypothetical protein [Streptomyces fradiae]WOI59575.1 hypothetical protein RYQ63_06445 [Streptomyces fradiae]